LNPLYESKEFPITNKLREGKQIMKTLHAAMIGSKQLLHLLNEEISIPGIGTLTERVKSRNKNNLGASLL